MAIPVFYGDEEEDSYWWVLCVEKYFKEQRTPEKMKLPEVVTGLQGPARQWWFWRSQLHPPSCWDTFTSVFLWHFKPEWREILPVNEEEEETNLELQLLHMEHEEEEDVADISYKGELPLMLNTSAIVSSNLSNFTHESLHKPPSSVQNPTFPNCLQHPSLTLSTPCVPSCSPKLFYFEEKQQEPPPKPPDTIAVMETSFLHPTIHDDASIRDKSEEAKSQQSTVLMHLQDKLCVPSHDSSWIHDFLPTQHLATFDFTGTNLFETSHHGTTTNSPYLSWPRSVNKTQQPYFDSSLLLNIEAPFSDAESHDNGDFTIPPKPPDSKDTSNKLRRPPEIRRCPVVLAENLCLLNFRHRFISLLKPLISFLIHSLEQLFEASATKIRNCSSRLDFHQSSLDESLILRVFVIKQDYKQLVGFELKKLVLNFANLLLTLCLVFDPGPHHLRHCLVGYGATLTDNTLNITNSTYRIIEDFLLFSFVEANSNCSKFMMYITVKDCSRSSILRKTTQARWWSKATIVMVTGGNKGIGFEVFRKLADHEVIVTLISKVGSVGVELIKVLQEGDFGVSCYQLPALGSSSITQFSEWVKENYGGPSYAAFEFEKNVYCNKVLIEQGENGAFQFISQKTTMFPPNVLLQNDVPVYKALQKPGEFVISFPKSYHDRLSHVKDLVIIVAHMVQIFLIINFGYRIFGVMTSYGGFYREASDIPKPCWKYTLHYSFFHKYARQGLFKRKHIQQWWLGEDKMKCIYEEDCWKIAQIFWSFWFKQWDPGKYCSNKVLQP